MNQTSNQMPETQVNGTQKMDYGMGGSGQKNRMGYIIIVVVVVVALALFWWWWTLGTETQNLTPTPEAPAELQDINQDLEGLDLEGLDQEFDQIDQELDTL